jgi:type I restriction enzyme S subunit
MSNWKEYKLGEIAKVKGGKRLPKGSILTTIVNTHPYIRVRDMGSKYMPTSNLEYVPDDVFPSIKNYIVDKKDVILSIVGSVGLVSIVNDKLDKANLTENCVKILPDTKTLNKEFLYYFLSSSIGQNEIYKKIVGAVQPKLPIYNINDISINLPDLPTQTAIAEILSSLDDKIELNNKINQELENLAQTLFKQWFIDFEFPNQNGEPYKSSGGEMVDSELGEIPKGWEVGTFGDLCKIVNGYAFKSKDFQEKGSNGILKIRNINGNVVDIINTQFVSNGVVQSVQDKFKVLSGHILIAMTGAEVGKTGIVPETDRSLWLNQRVGRLEPIIDNSKVFIYHMFNVLNFTQAVRSSAMGSAQPNISASGIESLNCLIPAEEVALNFSSINLDSFNLTLKNMGENQELTNLRDTLLPKLISGELEVSEVKEG